jgi:hypothetical protein
MAPQDDPEPVDKLDKLDDTSQLWIVDTGYAYGGIVVRSRDGIVIEAANIYGWMTGKPLAEVQRWRRIVEIRRVT